jgi:hypothetical protein
VKYGNMSGKGEVRGQICEFVPSLHKSALRLRLRELQSGNVIRNVERFIDRLHEDIVGVFTNEL